MKHNNFHGNIILFGREAREIKGFGSLREDFYTKFKPKKCGFGAVTWRKESVVFVGEMV